MEQLPALVMGRRAFAWIVAHEREFLTFSDGDAGERQRLKYTGELALIAGTLCGSLPQASGLVDRAWDALDRGERLTHLLPRWPIVAVTYLPFLLAGRRSTMLEQCLGDPAWLAGHARLAPFARFAIGVTLELLEIPRPWDEAQTILANRFFERPTAATPPIRAELLAHAVMWRTQMGRHPAGLGTTATRMYRDVAREWHRVLTAVELLDPLGEMIVSDVCARSEPPAASIELLCRAQREDGAMPPRPGHPETAFEDLYHTTCVAALAGVLTARGAGT